MFCINRKANPFLSPGYAVSMNNHLDLVKKNASKVTYPYQLILGEKDVIVDNAAARSWNDSTKSSVKQLKLMAGSYHELSKEPNSKDFIECVLTFAAKQAPAGTKGFGDYDFKKVKINQVPSAGNASAKKRKFRLLAIIYFIIGLILAILRKSKRMLLIWPAKLLH